MLWKQLYQHNWKIFFRCSSALIKAHFTSWGRKCFLKTLGVYLNVFQKIKPGSNTQRKVNVDQGYRESKGDFYIR